MNIRFPYLFRSNEDQYTRITRIEYVFSTCNNIVGRYVTSTYCLHGLHVWVLGGYVSTTYPKYILNANCPWVRIYVYKLHI